MGKISNKENEYEGVYRSASKLFGFVLLDTNEEIYVASKDSLFALNDDKVIVKIINNGDRGKSREGKIIKILEKANDFIIGIFEPNKSYGFVTPINRKIPFDIHIEKKFFGKAVKDSIVKVMLLTRKHKGDNPEGMIIDVIGHKNNPLSQISAIVKDFKIKDEFNEETIREANAVAKPIGIKDIVERVDLRDKSFVTIDGEDTKDIDDAVYLEEIDNGNIKLYVSIADVSHYVKEDGAIDREAKIRGNSVYLLDRVIPMIPHILSNGMCSLNESEDRLTMTCEMEYDSNGNMVSHNIYESIINSHKRMTYNIVQEIIDNGTTTHVNSEISKMILKMVQLSRILREKRVDRGSINFNISETYIEVDEDLNPINICEKKRIEAYDLIEDFMVAANETVAKEFYFREVPFLYRTHEKCDEDKLQNLSMTLNMLGIPFVARKDIKPKEIQKLLNEVQGKEYQYVIERLTLRSMSQARYTVDAIGHFALALKYYTHFTSPIRRYNDLQIHRIMKEVLSGTFDDDRKKHYDKILDNVALNISKTERVAIDCERDINALKECEFMKDKLGEEYDGVISGLTNFGIFVELPNTIEGMIPLRDMRDDHYIFDESVGKIVGKKTNKEFRFGQKVRVQLVRVNPDIRAIDFDLI